MTDHLQSKPRAYSACVDFLSDGWLYAREVYQVEAGDEFEAERLARRRAQDSVYFNLRIPDLAMSVAIDPTDLDTEAA
ncbi:hypothetical protein [Sphingomonas sp. VDB2]|uniref:hypothetical protein n=1 Tax=Sphingomonas sp. VDB2 TaxID=3228751 RepID=UPI003A80A201|nr:hypothetical protein [Sphingobium sp.]